MKIKQLLLPLLSVLFSVTSVKAQILTSFQEDFLSRTDPQSYYSFKSAESIWQEGVQLVDYMAGSLDANRNLTTSSNPAQLISDFNSKMTNINNLKSELTLQGLEQSFTTGFEAGNKLLSGDIQGGAMDMIGGLAASRARSQAKKDMERQQAELKSQLNSKMNRIYQNAQTEATKQQNDFFRLAAFSLDKKEEKYHLDYADNITCFKSFMKDNYQTNSSGWLVNNCPYPSEKPSVIENTFIAKDVQYAGAAKRKYSLYQSTSNSHFLNGARSFMSAAIKENAKAEYYKQLISYYNPETEAFEVLALSNALKKNFGSNFSNADNAILEKAKGYLVSDLVTAIKEDNQYLITLYLEKGIDRYVKENAKKTPIRLAVESDSPDAIQLILNKKLEGKSQTDKNAVLQSTILMASAMNSYNTVDRFINLGVPTDFELKGYTPADIAYKTKSYRSFMLLAENSITPELYSNKINEIKTTVEEEKTAERNAELAEKSAEFKANLESFNSFDDLRTFFQYNSKLLQNKEILKELWNSKNEKLLINAAATNPPETHQDIITMYAKKGNKALFFPIKKKDTFRLVFGLESIMLPASETVTLNFIRPGRFVAAAAPYIILINGEEAVKIKNKDTASVKLPAGQYDIMIKNAYRPYARQLRIYPFQKEIDLVVDPNGYTWYVAPKVEWMRDLGVNPEEYENLPGIEGE